MNIISSCRWHASCSFYDGEQHRAVTDGLARLAGLSHPFVVSRSFRLVCRKREEPLVLELLAAQGFLSEPEPFDSLCFRLLAEPFPLGASLAARFGLIYIQDRSSMLPPLALHPQAGAAVLDMCASPGGKTSFLGQIVGREGYVLGNEPGADRLATLRQNMARMNLPQVVTTGAKGQELALPDASFGSILLDPPCSGWGTADKNPQVLKLWRADKVEPLVSLQRELLAKAWKLLAPGGRLLYSTCTTNKAENEDQAAWASEELGFVIAALEPFAGFRFLDPESAKAAGTLRVDGEESQAQGFYLALLVKPGGSGQPAIGAGSGCEKAPAEPEVAFAPGKPRKPRQAGNPKTAGDMDTALLAERSEGCAWDNLPPGRFELFKDELCFLPARGEGLFPVRRKGQRLGSLKGEVFRPWGRARILLPSAGDVAGLDVDEPSPIQALLEGRSIPVGLKASRMGLYFRGLPLGYLTVKGGRALWSDR